MKRILATALAVLLIATMAISGSVAYLTSTDNAENTFTMGEIKIDQIEQERKVEGDETKLIDFVDNHPLLPGHEFREGNTPVNTELTISDKIYKLWETKAGAIDKIVTVRNTGENDAYVRTIFALEDTAEIATNDQIWLNWNGKNEHVREIDGRVEINGEYYRLYEYTYTEKLAKDATTEPSLLQVAMDAKVGNDIVDAIAASKDGRYSILVATQAVQADNMKKTGDDGKLVDMTATEALDAAFYPITAQNNPWTKGEVEDIEDAAGAGNVICISSKEDLLALNNKVYSNGTTTIVLTKDIDMEDASMSNIVISGSGTVLNINGNGYTISNVKFDQKNFSNNQKMFTYGLFYPWNGATLNVSNLTVDGVSYGITENDDTYAAAIVPYAANSTIMLDKVTVCNSQIVNNVGATAGLIAHAHNANVTLKDCKVYNCTITGQKKSSKYDNYNYNSKVAFGEDGVSHKLSGAFVGTAAGIADITITNCINGTSAPDWCRCQNTANINGTGMQGVFVSNASELKTAINALNGIGDNANLKIVLTRDITLTDNWTPVDINFKSASAPNNPPLAANINITIDGAGHSISGLKVASTLHSGLIGRLDDFEGKFTIENLTLKDIDLAGNNNAAEGSESTGGALIAWLVGNNGEVEIDRVHVEDGTIKDSKYIGGLIGYIEGTNGTKVAITNCSVTGVTLNSTYAEENKSKGHVGGLVGGAYNGNISNCTTKNLIITGSTDENRAGALIGSILSNNVNIGSGNKCIKVKVNNVVADANNSKYKGSVDNRNPQPTDSIAYN